MTRPRPRPRRRRRRAEGIIGAPPGFRWLGLVVGLTLVLATGCRSDPDGAADRSSPTGNLPVDVVVVNYEVVADEPSRFLVGLVLPDNRLVAFGTVQMRFAQLDASGQAAGASQVVRGTYLPLPGTEAGASGDEPRAIAPATVRGVYEIEGATFASAGPWTVEVAANVAGVGVVQGRADFEVLAEPGVPGVGQRAPRSDNPVIGDPAPASTLDSRARSVAQIPDRRLHERSIADGIAARRPVIAVFSTPVYCTSRFCGPVTDMVQAMERDYRGRATFVHVEIWEDFASSTATETAIEWLLQGDTLNEPWLFLIDDQGRIAARWDNIFVRPEVEDELDQLLGD